jgi:uncharacterized protein (TIGR03790 family)
MRRLFALLPVLPLAILHPGSACALDPAGVFPVVNKKLPASRELAEYYCKARNVPVANIIELDLPTGEDVSRADYDKLLVAPLREALKERKDKVQVLLCFHGVPLRVGRAEPNPEEKKQAEEIQKQLAPLEKERADLDRKIKEADEAKKTDEASALRKERDALQRKLRPLEAQRSRLRQDETQAAVDSELALLWETNYPLYRWQPNSQYFRLPPELAKKFPAIVPTCRLDGPTPALVKRLIDDAIAVEKEGLTGKVYVDARGIKWDRPSDPAGTGYGGYDEALREMATLLGKKAELSVVLDDRPELFGVGTCPEAALYCGWYSHGQFVDCCKFNRGAVAYHIASSEAVSLRDPASKLWCKNLLEKGACVTLGPVAEPYTVGFPKPAEFFGLLVTGEYTVVECYWKTVYFTSWMTTFVGDPLYNPYKKTPKIQAKDVAISPAGAALPFANR